MGDPVIEAYLSAFHKANTLCKPDMVPEIVKDNDGFYVVTIGWPTRYTQEQIESMTKRLENKVDSQA